MKKFKVRVGNENIEVMTIINKEQAKPNFVFLHGAGQSNKERVQSFSPFLIDKDLSLLSLDFSGHGASSGTLEQSSLQKRAIEAKTIINQYADLENLTVCGSSMGAYVTLKMLEYFPVKNLILICSAIYDKDAYTLQFNEGFSETIRKPDSWRNSDVLENLQKFRGNVLIIIGEQDEVIPNGVLDLLSINSTASKKMEIMKIPKCSHLILKFLQEHQDIAKQVAHKIKEYMA